MNEGILQFEGHPASSPSNMGRCFHYQHTDYFFFGVLVLMESIRCELPFITYIVDVIFCFITGALMLLFRKEALKVNSAWPLSVV
jgi:hypothetical protein